MQDMLSVSTGITKDSGSSQNGMDYFVLLQEYGFAPRGIGFWWQIGTVNNATNWVIHLSVIKIQIPDLLQVIAPLLRTEDVPFRIIKDGDVAAMVLEGNLGYLQLGKVVTIYPHSSSQMVSLCKKLLLETSRFYGPDIPKAIRLSGIVFVSYERITTDFQAEIEEDPVREFPNWPFEDIAKPTLKKPSKLINKLYYTTGKIKLDAKGEVTKGLYFKHFWQIKPCIIKQGRKYMFTDEEGRDIRERLKWQYEVYQQLKDYITLPVLFDYFMEGEDAYLVMEYIQGKSLSNQVLTLLEHRSWFAVPTTDRVTICDHLLEVLEAVDKMHQRGYIHRDVTPENFIITPRKQVYLIDLELTWSTTLQYPEPPFKLGSPGFISPEQQAAIEPTSKEDVYGAGALLLMCFTGMHPLKLETTKLDRLATNLHFFIGDRVIGDLIRACLDPEPFIRPTLTHLKEAIELYKDRLRKPETDNPGKSGLLNAAPGVHDLIEAALWGLTGKELLGMAKVWQSPTQVSDKSIGNIRVDMSYYEGFHTGIAGVLYILSVAFRAGFTIEHCQVPADEGWKYILNKFKDNTAFPPGLYMGSAGLALVFSEWIDTGLMQLDSSVNECLLQFFAKPTDDLSLSNGIAGQGIALLHCVNAMDSDTNKELLLRISNILIDLQNKDGSWRMVPEGGKARHILTGIDWGVSGPLLFLLNYSQRTSDDRVKATVVKGLNWLIKQAIRKGNQWTWPVAIHHPQTDRWNIGKGTLGISLVFMKAFEVLETTVYQEIAEAILGEIPEHLILMDFTWQSGLSGIGELYLEAYRIFKNEKWKKRADWLVEVFRHSIKSSDENAKYWKPAVQVQESADLFIGNAGILHFLISYAHPDQVRHPLLPTYS